ncbi:MAG: DNA gyrase inhibitor YacG [Rubrivivax sp.]|nr:DNA gyrase inhibitor YacG [Rubrivivax sp.]
MPAAAPARMVPCPTCGRRSAFTPANRWRPFCSEHCRSIDLGAWASERFRLPADAPPDPGDEWQEGSPAPRPPGE